MQKKRRKKKKVASERATDSNYIQHFPYILHAGIKLITLAFFFFSFWFPVITLYIYFFFFHSNGKRPLKKEYKMSSTFSSSCTNNLFFSRLFPLSILFIPISFILPPLCLLSSLILKKKNQNPERTKR